MALVKARRKRSMRPVRRNSLWLKQCPLHRVVLVYNDSDTARVCPVCIHVAMVKVQLAMAAYTGRGRRTDLRRAFA